AGCRRTEISEGSASDNALNLARGEFARERLLVGKRFASAGPVPDGGPVHRAQHSLDRNGGVFGANASVFLAAPENVDEQPLEVATDRRDLVQHLALNEGGRTEPVHVPALYHYGRIIVGLTHGMGRRL